MVDEDIARWLHEVELTPGSDRQNAIAAAATKFAATASTDVLPDLVLLAHRVVSGDAHDLVTRIVREHDDTFACDSDELETHLAASVFVAAVMERNALAASAAAMLVLSAATIGLDSPVDELTGLAESTVRRRSDAVRARGVVKSTLDTKGVFDGTPAFASDGLPVQSEEARALREASVDALDATSKALAALATRLSSRLNAADEELDLLWWCFNARSGLIDRRWSAIDDSGLAAVAAGIEMGGYLKFPSPPASATQILTAVLGDHADASVMFQDAVTAAGEAGLLRDATGGHQLLPVTSSLHEYHELKGDGWEQSVRRWQVDTSPAWTALELAGQTVRELILAGVLR